MKKIGMVNAVLVGKIVPFAKGSQSAINKKLTTDRQQASRLGFIHDEQGDRRFHGGVEKALHCYASEHYPEWRKELGEKPIFQALGAFGENISSIGLNEDTICLKDKIRIGTTLLEVSQGRMPCWKLNIRFEQHDMAQRLQNTLRTGWYFRVLDEGYIGEGDEIILCDRPYPDWPLSRIMKLIFEGCLDEQALQQVLNLPLVDSWRKLVENRLEKHLVEDWSSRLYGPEE
ncbi:MOSC domain-containing protein [Shewanella violacea]|uniref:MOSC domain protein n=1 Tax=Shewanella violacea (strain JCM 10179 / CIP 106290 / LMG 19151 / DSS12) TaxID=637905 RepID=D4ZAW6_SHEVD|nr:MOSC domain-containing protein [Shewanella violacea]BAJ03161.1 MOSC domain protein [Shewanella violacea DSS12]